MILTRKREEKISRCSLESLGSLFDGEGPGFAQTVFDDDVNSAEESQVLERRAVVVAHLVGEAMSSYAGSRSPLDDPWMAWRREPADEPAGEFVHSLKEEEFFCARVAYHIYAAANVRRPSCVPSDGDLEDIPGYLETEYAPTWPQWLEVLGTTGDAALLYPATTAARRDLDEGHSRSDPRVESMIAELMDRVGAFQMPTIERLDSIGTRVDALGAPDRFKAEELLKGVLGAEVYSSLCDDARTAALDAERRFRDRETLDWNSVTAELAKAFEIQVKQRFVPLLAEFLRQKGIRVFPDNEPLPDRDGETRWPIIKGGQSVPKEKLSLGAIEKALGSPLPQLREFGRTYGFDLAALEKLIHEMSRYRNPAAHETGMSDVCARSLRNKWLGVTARDGGILGALLPRTG
jgi:hypothetical protein